MQLALIRANRASGQWRQTDLSSARGAETGTHGAETRAFGKLEKNQAQTCFGGGEGIRERAHVAQEMAVWGGRRVLQQRRPPCTCQEQTAFLMIPCGLVASASRWAHLTPLPDLGLPGILESGVRLF